jgi:predicted ATPase/class 3 adenylate cyclase
LHSPDQAAGLPTGKVTFLFTDIEGSTRLLDELGDDYAALLAEHNRVMRSAIAEHRGVVVDTGGDSFFTVFERASDAVAAAAAAQDALAEIGVRVRMGIHSGEPIVSDEDYVGMDVHRAARVMAAGHGGQVLLTQPTGALLEGAFELRDLGAHWLKDLPVPLRLFQLGTGEFPPLRSLDQARLPIDLYPLVGRKRELGDLVRRLGRDRERVVTLTGPGGVGKTRLATAAAQELVESYDDGVTFVDLAPIRDSAVVLPTIADALRIEGDPGDELGTRQLLLVLDNVEQVVDAAPDVARLLVAAPGLAVLATSREPLRIPGEHEFRLRPLAEAPAVELFRQRASAARYDFEGDYRQLAAICERLDNLPLAIELAAARMKVLSPDVLLERLDRRLSVLAAANRGVPARQQTLRATIQWSYGLLTSEERRLFDRLAVFRGGWTVDAAEAVCGADLDTLTSLVDKNLVREDGERFRMLGTVWEYARERLDLRGESADLRRRHAGFYAQLGEAAQPHLRGPGREWLDRVEAEHDNFRAALAWSLAEDLELGFRIAESLLSFWHLRAHEAEVRRWAERALEASAGLSSTTRAAGLHVLGALLFWEGDFERSARALEESLALYRAAGDRRHVAELANTLGNSTWALGDRKRTRRLREEAIRLCWELRDPRGVARTLHYIGEESRDTGDRAGARRAFEESLDVMRELGDKSFVMASLHGLGDLELDSNDLSAASERYRESLALALELDTPNVVLLTLAGLASVAAASGDLARAGHLWATVEAMEERRGIRILPFERERYERTLDPYVSDAAFAAALAEGKELTQADALNEALAPG